MPASVPQFAQWSLNHCDSEDYGKFVRLLLHKGTVHQLLHVIYCKTDYKPSVIMVIQPKVKALKIFSKSKGEKVPLSPSVFSDPPTNFRCTLQREEEEVSACVFCEQLGSSSSTSQKVRTVENPHLYRGRHTIINHDLLIYLHNTQACQI